MTALEHVSTPRLLVSMVLCVLLLMLIVPMMTLAFCRIIPAEPPPWFERWMAYATCKKPIEPEPYKETA